MEKKVLRIRARFFALFLFVVIFQIANFSYAAINYDIVYVNCSGLCGDKCDMFLHKCKKYNDLFTIPTWGSWGMGIHIIKHRCKEINKKNIAT